MVSSDQNLSRQLFALTIAACTLCKRGISVRSDISTIEGGYQCAAAVPRERTAE